MPELSLPRELGQLVRRWRMASGLSQEALAYRCGIHRTYMTHIEQGTKMPSIVVVAKIARGFGVELSDMFRELEDRGVTVSHVTEDPWPR